MALAQCTRFSGTYITTPQNLLIDQYKREFKFLGENTFYHIKGRRHYKCRSYNDCDEGKKMKCSCMIGKPPTCTYAIERDTASMASICLTNTTYYALAMRGGSEHWGRRALTVIDEAHNLAGEVLNLISFTLTNYKLHRIRIERTIPKWPADVPIKSFLNYLEILKEELDFVINASADEDFFGGWQSHEIEEMEKLKSNIQWFTTSVAEGVEWIVEYRMEKAGPKVTARPLDTAYFAKKMFFEDQANKYVLQSATIVDFKMYAAELGITKEEAAGVVRPSPFPKENRPLYNMCVGSMAYKDIQDSLPKMLDAIKKILVMYPKEKGIIHTVNYRTIQEYIQDRLFDRRLILATPEYREEALEEHIRSKKPSVLVSPSMTEGIDMRDDLARFQILCKVPYPSLADKRVKILANRNWNWYNYQAAKTLVQTVGRGCRSETDWCHNYMLDSCFNGFMKRATLPADFLATVQPRKTLV